MIVDENSFVRRYSFVYTFIVSIIMLAPLYFYVNHKLNVQDIKTEIELKGVQAKILSDMEHFGISKEKVYLFPSFISFSSGLYSNKFEPIYTQIKESLNKFSQGYHNKGNKRYLITSLPPKKYFNAGYLITSTTISYASVMLESSLLAFGIILLILLLSIYFLKSFSLPFKRVNEKLDLFIKDSMHEINTPLSIINVNIDLFENIHGDNKYLQRIKSATKSLSTIYHDMDYLIKQNRIDYPDESINLKSFLQQRMDYFKLIGELKDVTFRLEMSEDYTLYFNPTKLERLVDNNLSNALKFSHKHDFITIKVEKNKNNHLLLSFIDQGLGIEKPNEVFKRYYREKHQKNGFGIGLDIVRNICEHYRISIKVSSEPSVQTIFSYEIPESNFK